MEIKVEEYSNEKRGYLEDIEDELEGAMDGGNNF